MIRPAGPADPELIAALEQDIFGSEAWSIGQVEADVNASWQDVVVAEVAGEVVGYAALALAGDIVDLTRIAVRPAQRRGGVATALLAEVERRADESGADRVVLEVASSNHGARNFYAARGYAEIARREHYYANGDDALVYIRLLGENVPRRRYQSCQREVPPP